jgi:hypothetical protein
MSYLGNLGNSKVKNYEGLIFQATQKESFKELIVKAYLQYLKTTSPFDLQWQEKRTTNQMFQI